MAKKKVFLTRDAILAVDDLPIKEVKVPEWGGSVFVRSLTAADRDKYESSIVMADSEEKKYENIRARFLALVMVDQKGEVMFKEEGDVLLLGKKSAAALDRVWGVAQHLNKINKADIDQLSKN